ncbi:Cytochrome P450 [Geosmithia morbida]|uniref:Cytochrome P450 n=1 Tax=Geosmithia morbida TaxID=1094350 RepID=A0A9P5D8L6_9HYPO|nr:Cytochrome P450 [Geosmithia morbida]KAF4126920.1 Cytochrome P450 [Geosmithia morbida]
MAPSSHHVALPGDFIAVLTLQNLLVLTAIFIVYHAVKALYSIYIYPFYTSPLRHLPTPTENHHWILGQAKNLFSKPWIPYFYRDFSSRYPDSPFIRILKVANAEVLVPNTISAYREILQTKSECFVKPSESRTGAIIVIGEGLPWSHGNIHRLRRTALNKLFSPQRMKACEPRVRAKVEQMATMLAAKRMTPGDPVDIESEIWKATLDIAGIKTMGTDLNHLGSGDSPLYDIFTTTMRPTVRGHVTRLMVAYMPFRSWLPMEALSEFASKCAAARDFILGHVRERRSAWERSKSRPGEHDAALLQAMVENDGLWNDGEVVEHVLNFMILVQWIPRESTCDLMIDGVAIPKGTRFNLVPAMVNLKPEIWGPDAAVFDPDRWNPDRLTGDAGGAYSFATFHNGPRVCIGKALTYMEMKLMIVELVSKYRLATTHVGELEMESPSFTLKPKDRVKLQMTEI